MGILDMLNKKEYWEEFYNYKTSGGHMSKSEIENLRKFIDEEGYSSLASSLLKGEGFCLPTVSEINKKSAKKKRTVFMFPPAENYVLKFIACFLFKYDNYFSDNLYSFRRNISVKHAVRKLTKYPAVGSMYSYKLDISDYFNSVDTSLILPLLNKVLWDDKPLCDFLTSLLTEPKALKNGVETEAKKGIMAGVPISGFLANLYLSEMDEYFASQNLLYARYSDDIIIFAQTQEEIIQYEEILKSFLNKYNLSVNDKKEFRTLPNQRWEFLGFSFEDGEVDVSSVSLQKLKAKMRRQSRSLIRWKTRANAIDERAIRAFFRHFNKKFYNNPIHNEVTWCRWYFPIINTDKSLREIDNYMCESARYIATGKHTKANYNLRYETLKSYGYKSLVNSYYKYKKEEFK